MKTKITVCDSHAAIQIKTVDHNGTNNMSQPLRNTIRVNLSADAFSIEGNKNIFDKIVADQEKNSGRLRPAKNWDLEIGGQNGGQYFESRQRERTMELKASSDEQYARNFSSLQKMMDPFVGSVGLQGINKNVISNYYDFLKGIDHLEILPNYFDPNGEMKSQASGLLITDLGSMIDINIISSFLDPTTEKYRIAEVGGGYGRLAEGFLNIYGKKSISYLLLDAVPAGLMYSYLYLSKNFPDLRIGFYYNEDPFNMDLFDCYIMPVWHFDFSSAAGRFDCCINIQSMQEMEQHHVDYYLNMFNKLLKNETGIVYLSNEKDYIFQGEWNYPANWRLLLKTRTPRSWTRNSPTEVFIKETGSFEKENQLLDSVYSLQLRQFDKNLDQLKIISSVEDELKRVREEASGIERALEQVRQDVSSLQLELQRGQRVLARMPLASEKLTIEGIEKSIQNLNEYYGSKELPEDILVFEKYSKINAHLIAVNLYLRQGYYRMAMSHLFEVFKMDPLILFSIQSIRILGNGLRFQLKPKKIE